MHPLSELQVESREERVQKSDSISIPSPLDFSFCSIFLTISYAATGQGSITRIGNELYFSGISEFETRPRVRSVSSNAPPAMLLPPSSPFYRIPALHCIAPPLSMPANSEYTTTLPYLIPSSASLSLLPTFIPTTPDSYSPTPLRTRPITNRFL